MDRIEQKIWNVGVSAFVFSLHIVLRVAYETKLPTAYSAFTMSTFGPFDLYLASIIPCIGALIVTAQFIKMIHHKVSLFDVIVISAPMSAWFLHFGLCHPVNSYLLLAAITLPIFTYMILNYFPKRIYSGSPLISHPVNFLKILITIFSNAVLIFLVLTSINGIHTTFQVVLFILLVISIMARIMNNKIWLTLWFLSVLIFTYIAFKAYPIFSTTHSETFNCV